MMDFQVPQRAQAPTEFPRFYMDKLQNNYESERQGRPVWIDVEMVEIVVAGDSRSTWAGKVKDEHRERWPKAYEAFKAGLEPAHDGTPVEHWPPLTPAQVANLKALKIHTVEQLAGVSDGHLQNIGLGARELRDRAAIWLKAAKDGAETDRLRAERDEANAKQADTQRQLDELRAVVDRLTEKLGEQKND